ncbi:MAG: transposase [Firmicutes bacterium]|nr:transposase [Bacillota bacterium]
MPILAHKIRLDPTSDQIQYFKQASGTARLVWNWALDEWNRQYAAGQKPQGPALKKQFNAVKYQQFPWLHAIHRDAHAQPFADLAGAWHRFFTGHNDRPVFKKKGKTPDSFYIANDKLQLRPDAVRIPQIGWVSLTEPLRFSGKIMGSRVTRRAEQWFIAIQVEGSGSVYHRPRTGNGHEGADVGVKTFVTLSTAENIGGPKALRKALRRIKMRQRAITRKLKAAKGPLGLTPKAPIPKGTVLPVSHNRTKATLRVGKSHLRIANIRKDFLHKTSARLCRENQALGVETLSVAGMMKNHHLAQAIADQGFGQFFTLLQYKAARYGTQILAADRWFPSSKLCSTPDCGYLNQDLTLTDREWTCPSCGITHDRDENAAINLKRLATETALPVAMRSATDATGFGDPALDRESDFDGKVTPVRYEARPAGCKPAASGQEEVGRTIAHRFYSS